MRGGFRRSSVALSCLMCAAAPGVAAAQVNAEALAVEASPVAVAGGGLEIVATVRIEPGMTVSMTPYLTQGGVIAGAQALPALSVPQPSVGRTVRIETTASVPVGAHGVFTVAIVLDAADAVPESNELDNVAVASSVTRVRPPRPDPNVAALVAAAPRARPGDPVSIDLTVSNPGELPASVEIGAFLSRDDEIAPSDTELGRVTVDVAAGATVVRNLSGVVPADLAPGQYVLATIVDPSGVVDEVHENNNVSYAGGPFTVYADALTLDTAAVPGATVTIPYHVALEASGGDGRHDFTVAQGDLPDGLALTRAGVLSGTPERSGSFTFTVQVASDGKQDSQAYTIEVVRSNSPLTIATREATQGFLNMPYEQGLVAGGGEAPYEWDLKADGGALPPGLDLTPAGVISGVPNTLGTFNFVVEVEDFLGNRDEAALRIEVTSAANVIVLSSALDPFPVGEPVSVQLLATGGAQPYEWVAISPAPPGLSITEDGLLVGTPTQVGRFPVYVSVTDASIGRVRDTATIQIVVEDAGDFQIELTELPNGQVRQNYEVVLTARGGQPPLRWTVATGAFLPADFYLVDGDGQEAPTNAGLLYGFPIFDGVHAFTVRVEDAYGRRREQIYSLTVDTPQIDLGGGCQAVDNSGALTGILLVGGLVLIRRRRSARMRG